MKVAFVQNVTDPLLGYMYMSSCLKRAGHDCEVFVENFEKDLLKSLREFEPDIVGYQCLTGYVTWGLSLIRELKLSRPRRLSIFGGPHPTHYTAAIHADGIDAICIGEGEGAIVDVANRYDGSIGSISTIRNIWVKEKGRVRENPLRPLIADLDALPFPDRSLYARYERLFRSERATVLASRGCAFNCTYCHNHAARKLYKDLGAYLRFRSPENVIAEILEMKKGRGSLKRIVFNDSTLNVHHEWFMRLMRAYAEHVRIPFTCHLRADVLNDEQIEALKQANCRAAGMSIESGSYRLRKALLKRDMTDQQILTAIRKLKRKGMYVAAGNMFGLPTETLADSYQTVSLNQKARADVVSTSLFKPFPGTELGKLAEELNLVDRADYEDMVNNSMNFYHRSVLRQKDIHAQERLQKLLFYFVKFPELSALWNFLAKHGPFRLLCWLFYAATAANVTKAQGYGWLGILRYAMLNSRVFFRK